MTEVAAIAGDVADPAHRRALIERRRRPTIDLLVNNASVLGPSPQPALADYPLDELERVYRVNVLAPLALAQLALPRLADGGAIINVTSDAAVEPYEGWGGYGSSKAALEQLTAILAAEHPELRVYAVDPGDMRTRMHQEAFPGEDISDRPPPEESVPGLLALIEGDAAERPLPRARDPGGDGRVSALGVRAAERARGARAAGGPRPRRDEVRLMVASRTDEGGSSTGRFRDCRSCSRPAICSSSTSRRRCPPRSPAAGADGSASASTSRRARPSSTRAGAWSSCAAPTAPGRRRGRPARRSASPAAARSSWSPRTRRPPADARPLRRPAEHVEELPAPPRRADPLRLRPRTLAARRPTRTSTRRRPAAPRCRAPGRPFTPELITALLARGILIAPITLHTGVSSPERHEPPFPEHFEVPERPRGCTRRPGRGAAA